nr:hypothetical protein CFP56_19267 [Quercus suber]POE93259.1 hypothetical protein CFP56_19271 [Quercus suber]
MPNGSLTPLGRQLHSVLVNLIRRPTELPHTSLLETRFYYGAAQVDAQGESSVHSEANGENHGFSIRRSIANSRASSTYRRAPFQRPDHLGRALSTTDAPSLVASTQSKKSDFALANPRNKRWRRSLRDHDGHGDSVDREPSVQEILSRCIEHASTKSTPFTLRSREATFLLKSGFKLSDVQAWTSALLATDSLEAAMRLAEYTREKGWQAVPFVVHQYLLRRSYIKPAALRLIMRQIQVYLHAQYENETPSAANAQMLFVAFSRLVRHAREVWPHAIKFLAAMLLEHLSTICPRHKANPLAQETSILNEAMDLMSRPCAAQPLKDAIHTKEAVFHVLRYMAEHDPPIMLTRSGYRAVVRVQLSEKKTEMERQWAQLKALSWPPWKVDRTGKDSAITPEYGVSRAGHTLARMREAGYAPRAWEKAAMIYAGWDLDGTPSIQTRISAELDSSDASVELIWTARIRATRTAQEAWAAYLAFEDAGQSPSSAVQLAIFEKLFAEEKRLRKDRDNAKLADAINDRRREQILPGDSKEIAPPPSSSHLHTYTRTTPPTVLDFFESLEARGVMISGNCLAFIVRHAASLQLGFRYLQYGRRAHPNIKKLLLPSGREDSTELPDVIVTAVVELLCRYSGVSLNQYIAGTDVLRLDAPDRSILDNKTLNPYHTVVCAMKVLKLRAPRSRPAYNAVLRALCRDTMRDSMPWLVVAGEREKPLDLNEQELEKNRDVLVIYRLVSHTFTLMDAVSLQPDAATIYYLSCACENVAIASWNILKSNHEMHQMPDVGMSISSKGPTIVREAHAWIRQATALERVKHEFAALVGPAIHVSSGSESSMNSGHSLPRLLTVPHPWLLHAYVRALGWMGDHKALVMMMKWMIKHRVELATQMAQDRNGTSMMKKVLVAFRVFLERSWLSKSVGRKWAPGSEPQQALDQAQGSLQQFEDAAESTAIDEVKHLIASVDDWAGWPSDEDVACYCQNERFMGIRKLYE